MSDAPIAVSDANLAPAIPQSALTPLAAGFDLPSITCCPRCRAPLSPGDNLWLCADGSCDYAVVGFPVVSGQPVLVDFEHSVFERGAYQDGRGSVLPRDDTGTSLRVRIHRFAFGANPVAPAMCDKLLKLLRARGTTPLILVIGGGAIGSGQAAMYRDPDVRVVTTDVYASSNTQLLADGHRLPFVDGVFDAVWIQAVLEHVLEPQRVADEIHRVLKPDGLLYADTPFMQQVHEGAYDFTRFTLSGHRWLLRRFEEIQAGPVGGTGTALIWSFRYFARAFGANGLIQLLVMLPWFWAPRLERFMKRRPNADGASGVYFLGRRSDKELTPKQMVAYYGQQDRAPT